MNCTPWNIILALRVSCRLTYKPGDKRLDEFTQEDENPDAEYIVDCILDEKQRKGKSMYRLKWAVRCKTFSAQ